MFCYSCVTGGTATRKSAKTGDCQAYILRVGGVLLCTLYPNFVAPTPTDLVVQKGDLASPWGHGNPPPPVTKKHEASWWLILGLYGD